VFVVGVAIYNTSLDKEFYNVVIDPLAGICEDVDIFVGLFHVKRGEFG